MRIDIMTLFPEMCSSVLNESIIGRARKAGKVEINAVDIREFTEDKHRRVDDKPYGGGMGMVMQAQPVYDCYKAICSELGREPHFVYMTPQGKTLTQQRVKELAELENIVILCGHYEGIDERVIEELQPEEISVGLRLSLRTVFPVCSPEFFPTRNVLPRKAIIIRFLNIPSILTPRYGKTERFPRCFCQGTTQRLMSGADSRA